MMGRLTEEETPPELSDPPLSSCWTDVAVDANERLTRAMGCLFGKVLSEL